MSDKRPCVLVVDDLQPIHEMLGMVLHSLNLDLVFAIDGTDALARLKGQHFDLVLTDIDMKPMDGLALLAHIKEDKPDMVVVMMTAYASMDTAIYSLKQGAFDYLKKPFKMDELMDAVRRGLAFGRARTSDSPVTVASSDVFSKRFAGASALCKRLTSHLERLSAGNAPVLLSGEKGTGHELAAELLHQSSLPPEAPYVAVDCAVMDADALRAGLLGDDGLNGKWTQKAAGGTLVLMNVHAVPTDIQGALVPVARQAGTAFRLICTTTVDIETLLDEGKFSEELYYRIGSNPVNLPAIHERKDDLPAMIEEICSRAISPGLDADDFAFSADSIEYLKSYDWPGNLLELEHFVCDAIAKIESDNLGAINLPLKVIDSSKWPALSAHIAEAERIYRAKVSRAFGSDDSRTGSILNS